MGIQNTFFADAGQVSPDNTLGMPTAQEIRERLRFGVMLLGGFNHNEVHPSIDLFLKSASIHLRSENICHVIENNGMLFNLLIYVQIKCNLILPSLFSRVDLVFVAPDDAEDLYSCGAVLRRYEDFLPKGTKIFFLFPEESPKYSSLLKSAKFSGYEQIGKDDVMPILESIHRERLRRLENPEDETAINKNSTENKSFTCCVL